MRLRLLLSRRSCESLLTHICITPWQSFPDLQPLYDAARSYLEIPQRVDLLNARVEVLQDLLGLLKESVSSRHAERLEQIVIALIGVEIRASPLFLFFS